MNPYVTEKSILTKGKKWLKEIAPFNTKHAIGTKSNCAVGH